MAIYDLFSKRQKRLRGDIPDVYQYTNLPQNFRVQVVHIVKSTIGRDSDYSTPASKIYKYINNTLCREYGVFKLQEYASENFEYIYNFFLKEKDPEKCLDVIELTFKCIDGYVRQNTWEFRDYQSPDDAIEELNIRFREAGIGYQFESGEVVRVDSQFIHSDAVKPTLQILGHSQEFAGANDEFLSAHEHYRHQRFKECLNDCLKSFESLMKAIHKKRSWEYGSTDTAKKLISSCLSNGLIPDYMQNQFSSLRILLESGVPTIRNKEGGHGQGDEVTNVPEHLASYTLHLTASNLLFLAKCDENFTKKK
ncbi:STM4504/CBY_0614 family protein [Klebsiella variicola]|uniref:STM4504/CBY_0614 family protein n=1 Tax=Klebsiella variicola TaxID=244366 RepID=UPI00349F9805